MRGLIRTKQPTTSAVDPKFKVDTDVELCKGRAEELLACVGDLGDAPDVNSVPGFRLRQRLEHLDRRIGFWEQSGEVEDKWDTMPTHQQVRETLAKISASQGVANDDDGAPLPSKVETCKPLVVEEKTETKPVP